MIRCDFQAIVRTINKYIDTDKRPAQNELVSKLFFTYVNEFDIGVLDGGLVSSWVNNNDPVSSKIAKFYKSGDEGGDLAYDIDYEIFPLMNDIDMAENELYYIVMNDIGISPKKRLELIQNYKKDKANFFADITLFAVSRDFIKGKPDALAYGFFSPAASELISGGEAPKPCKFFCGRDDELEKLHNILQDNSKVFISGIAGIGKSEFVKAYAKNYKKQYTNILYYTYNGNLQRLIADMEFVDDMTENEAIKFSVHNRFLRALKKDSLIIIDNFNTTAYEEQFLEDLMQYNCCIIFTTRSVFDCGYIYELKEISDVDTLVELYRKFFFETEKYRDIVIKIIETIHHHTLAIEMSARLLQKGVLEPDELLERFSDNSVNPESTDKIGITKDGRKQKDTYYNLLHTLFSVCDLNDDRKNIMRCMTFIPDSGIIMKLFAKWLCLSDLNDVNDLVELGFIRADDNDVVSLHPVIRELSIEDLKPTYTVCKVFLTSLHNICTHHGIDEAQYKLLFAVIENVIKFISVDDAFTHLLFIEDAFDYMEKYNYESGMRKIIAEMEKCKSSFTEKDSALLYDFKAVLECQNGNFHSALEYSKQAIECLAPDSELLLSANLNMNLGYYYHLNGDLTSAETYMEKGMSLYNRLNCLNNDYIIMTHNYANLLSDCNKPVKAIRALKKCSKMLDNNSLDYAELLFDIGNIYLQLNKLKAALKAFEKAFLVFRKILPEAALKEKIITAVGFYTSRGIQDIPDFLMPK